MSWLLGAKALLRYPPFRPAPRRVLFCLETPMSDIIQLVPNKWVTEELLTATTGMS
ncbi:TPA: excisionase family protein, partial [Enterobacter hormaechei]|nr:excisionase family protein [Enterobacter hormaechei]